jgi:hypothetical protein
MEDKDKQLIFLTLCCIIIAGMLLYNCCFSSSSSSCKTQHIIHDPTNKNPINITTPAKLSSGLLKLQSYENCRRVGCGPSNLDCECKNLENIKNCCKSSCSGLVNRKEISECLKNCDPIIDPCAESKKLKLSSGYNCVNGECMFVSDGTAIYTDPKCNNMCPPSKIDFNKK